MFKTVSFIVFACIFATSVPAASFDNQGDFQNALDSFTLIDTSAFIGQTTFNISPTVPNGTFFGPDALVRSDDLILNGAGFHGSTTPHVGLNFDLAVNGAGVTSNAIDGGRIQIYSGPNGTGTLIEEASFGGGLTARFGGLITTSFAHSVVFTCDFNSDLKCGLRDIVFGTVSPVPLPAGVGLFIVALLSLVRFSRRVRT